jgi:hypothetical protein
MPAAVAPDPVVIVPPPPPPPPPPSKGSLQATASISIDVRGLAESEIRRGLDRISAVSAFQRCYHAAAERAGKTPAAEVRLTFEIDESRTARKVSAKGGGLPGLADCVSRGAGQIRTNNPPDVGTARVGVTVTFRPVP